MNKNKKFDAVQMMRKIREKFLLRAQLNIRPQAPLVTESGLVEIAYPYLFGMAGLLLSKAGQLNSKRKN